ncbi:MAG: glycosyl hydrolase [bacterium]
MTCNPNQTYLTRTLLAVFSGCLAVTAASGTGKHDTLEQSFITPAAHSKPWLYWYWMNGNVTQAGIKADLESMQRGGIGGAMVFDIGMGPVGPVRPRSPQWFENVAFTLKEAEKLGLQIGFNCPGWANSGGPWVTPELSMQELAWSETVVEGGCRVETALPQPAARLNYYRDIAVFAFPTPLHDELSLRTVQTTVADASGVPLPEGGKLFDNDPETVAQLPGTFELRTEIPVPVRSISIRAAHRSKVFKATFEAWNEEQATFVPVGKFENLPSGLNDRPTTGSATFAPVTAKRFRLTFMTGAKDQMKQPLSVYVQELNVYGGFRLQRWTNKTGFGTGAVNPDTKEPQPKPEETIAQEQVVQLTGRMNAEGRLTWDVPPGRWTVIRMGHIPTGAQSAPLPSGMQALEVDKLSQEACDVYYDGMMNPILQSVGPEMAKRVIANHHVDSYEVGWQNWTPKLAAEFKKRRGYDMTGWLPALTGRVIGSLEQTEAFLWDFRRTVCDCYADHHTGRLAERCRKDGLFFSTEAYDGPFEYLQAGGRSDVPMTEIWINSPIGTRPRMGASIAGHIYERQIIGSEEFTGLEKWEKHPATLKALADWSYCVGVNRLVMHVFTDQPWNDPHLRPGMTLGPWGCHLDRGNTWWEKGGPQWHTYLGRCQALLQQGSPVADVLFYLGDNAPNGDGNKPPTPLEGYDGDGLNGEILSRLNVADGKVALPGGKTYRYLVMPEHGRMTLASLNHVARLAHEGAAVLGPKPKGSPSLADQNSQATFTALAEKLWGNGAAGERKVSAGRVIWGRTLEDVMNADGLVPDFDYDPKAGLDLHFVHRTIKDADVYFVANSSPRGGSVKCRFRVSGKVPELWYPESGRIEAVSVYEQTATGVSVGLNLEQEEAVFVVFRKPVGAGTVRHIVGLSRDGTQETFSAQVKTDAAGRLLLQTATRGKYELTFNDGRKQVVDVSSAPEPVTVDGPWPLEFPAGWGAPEKVTLEKLISWPEHPDSGVRYFSGTAVYRKDFVYSDKSKSNNPKPKIELDLGRVEVIAEVWLNGKSLGTLWKPPFRMDVTDVIQSGTNALEVKVTNLWPNRLIGDEQYPDDCTTNGTWITRGIPAWPEWLQKGLPRPEPRRLTFTTFKHWKKDDALLPSGLIGPVVIRAVEQRVIPKP